MRSRWRARRAPESDHRQREVAVRYVRKGSCSRSRRRRSRCPERARARRRERASLSAARTAPGGDGKAPHRPAARARADVAPRRQPAWCSCRRCSRSAAEPGCPGPARRQIQRTNAGIEREGDVAADRMRIVTGHRHHFRIGAVMTLGSITTACGSRTPSVCSSCSSPGSSTNPRSYMRSSAPPCRR